MNPSIGPPPGLTIPPQYETPPITMQPPSATYPIVIPPLGPGPLPMTCPNCGASIMSAVSDVPIMKTHLFACGIFFIGCVLGCCLVPYCISGCQGQRHECPNCGHYLGMHK